jgi:hypothetical protein
VTDTSKPRRCVRPQRRKALVQGKSYLRRRPSRGRSWGQAAGVSAAGGSGREREGGAEPDRSRRRGGVGEARAEGPGAGALRQGEAGATGPGRPSGGPRALSSAYGPGQPIPGAQRARARGPRAEGSRPSGGVRYDGRTSAWHVAYGGTSRVARLVNNVNDVGSRVPVYKALRLALSNVPVEMRLDQDRDHSSTVSTM